MATLDAVLAAVRGLAGHSWQHLPRGLDFLEGNKLLREHTETLLGPSRADRSVRIMVTMPSEAASDYKLVRELVAAGMNCMRVNCSYDDRQAWGAMAEHLKHASCELAKECRLSMDLAGPKLRVGPMETGPEIIKVRPERDVTGMVLKPARIIRLVPQAHAGPVASGAESVPVPIATGALDSLRTGDEIEFTDTRGPSRANGGDRASRRVCRSRMRPHFVSGFGNGIAPQRRVRCCPTHRAAARAGSPIVLKKATL